MFTIDARQIKKFEKDLKAFRRRAYPFATKQTANDSAFRAMKLARDNLSDNFVLRNAFTKQSVQVNKARTLQLSRQSAEVGSTADYLETQEFGGVESKKGKEGVAIPTAVAAGQAEGTNPRTRKVTRSNLLANIRLRTRRIKAKSKKQRLLLEVREAVNSGHKYFFAKTKRKKGIFKVKGGRKGTTRGWPKGAKIQLIHDLTEQVVTTRPKPWLRPATLDTIPEIPRFYFNALKFQLKRHGLFKGR